MAKLQAANMTFGASAMFFLADGSASGTNNDAQSFHCRVAKISCWDTDGAM